MSADELEATIGRNIEAMAVRLYLLQMGAINEVRARRGLEPFPIHPEAEPGARQMSVTAAHLATAL